LIWSRIVWRGGGGGGGGVGEGERGRGAFDFGLMGAAGPAADVGLEPVADDEDFNRFEGGGLISESSRFASRSVRYSTELSRLLIASLGAEVDVLRLGTDCC
jgi:hypothetical protein